MEFHDETGSGGRVPCFGITRVVGGGVPGEIVQIKGRHCLQATSGENNEMKITKLQQSWHLIDLISVLSGTCVSLGMRLATNFRSDRIKCFNRKTDAGMGFTCLDKESQ